ncbi:MAG: CIA30 family protein [Treponema sp.]|jgi:hypothetical protein|nr:CIA30 family protein [Treponema sp.]
MKTNCHFAGLVERTAGTLFAAVVIAAAIVLAGCPGGPEEEETPDSTSYKVSIGELTNGSITANPTSADEGASVTLTIKPDVGYRLKGTPTVTAGETTVTVSGSGNSYTFAMPASDVTVTAEFELDPSLKLLEDFETVTGVFTTLPYWYAGAAYGQANADSKHDGNQGAQFNYGDITADPWYAGFGMDPDGADVVLWDLSEYNAITFWVKANRLGDKYKVQLKSEQNQEPIPEVEFSVTTTEWEQITISLADFAGLDTSSVKVFGIFASQSTVAEGALYVDTIQAVK